ncbi:hypothetical protein [Smaragdicoccus niigatensis]|uniref:hypothetical protein n=1 Tax=Smaragdicoccus niigatensis TaxID=359359 RepID=UPI00036335DE|nr:hypothetical protein [Smaragdicoccus niigatensis]
MQTPSSTASAVPPPVTTQAGVTPQALSGCSYTTDSGGLAVIELVQGQAKCSEMIRIAIQYAIDVSPHLTQAGEDDSPAIAPWQCLRPWSAEHGRAQYVECAKAGPVVFRIIQKPKT